MNYNIIASGSSGNAVLINDSILIDCGLPYSKIKKYIKNIKIVFLTHIHSDHFNKKTILKIHQERPTVRFACCYWLVKPLVDLGINKRNIDLIELTKMYVYKGFQIKAEETDHDVKNCCWKLFINKEKMIYATDLCNLKDIKAKNYDYYLIEGNYKKEELLERRKERLENGEYDLERRIMNTHTSYEDCIDYFLTNSKETSVLEVLHQHVEKGGTKDEG